MHFREREKKTSTKTAKKNTQRMNRNENRFARQTKIKVAKAKRDWRNKIDCWRVFSVQKRSGKNTKCNAKAIDKQCQKELESEVTSNSKWASENRALRQHPKPASSGTKKLSDEILSVLSHHMSKNRNEIDEWQFRDKMEMGKKGAIRRFQLCCFAVAAIVQQ